MTVTYQLPTEGPLPRTYRVTLATVLEDEPDWIVSTFVAGGVRTVTEQNRGVFTDTWDGMDENNTNAPLGKYKAKGIYMPAEQWKIDGEWHSLTAQYLCSPGDSWTPPRERDNIFPPIHGHLMEPIYTVSVAENGMACFYAGYIENCFNPFIVDMNKPIGIDQVVYRFPSGGLAGGQSCAYDGQNLWATRQASLRCLTNKRFGIERNRRGHQETPVPNKSGLGDLNVGISGNERYLYSADPAQKKIFVIHGYTGQILKEVDGIEAVATFPDRVEKGKKLHLLLKTAAGGLQVGWVALQSGMPTNQPHACFTVPKAVGAVTDLAMDRKGNYYLLAGQNVFKMAPDGRLLRTFGKPGKQWGKYDPDKFVGVSSIETWTDKEGKDRLLVCEAYGFQRVSEWDCESGTRIRQWLLCQDSHAGFCMDPAKPEHLYVKSLLGAGLQRYRVNYDTGEWELDALWTGICNSHAGQGVPHAGLFPRIINHPNGEKYLFFGGGGYRVYGGCSIYRIKDYDVIPSSMEVPGGNYWADSMLPDLTVLHLVNKSHCIQSMAPSGFDEKKNPIYGKTWQTAILDPAPLCAQWGGLPKPDALHGGNEKSRSFWGFTDFDGVAGEAIYVAGVYGDKQKDGIDTAAKMCDVWKLTCWIPNSAPGPAKPGAGMYKMKWRTGRTSDTLIKPGEVYSTMNVCAPVYNLIGMQDVNGLYHVYTDDGMYVDTLMHHTFKYGIPRGGMYSHSGETWYGRNYLNSKNGKVYIFMGRANNNIYEVPNWKPGFVKPLELKIKTDDAAGG